MKRINGGLLLCLHRVVKICLRVLSMVDEGTSNNVEGIGESVMSGNDSPDGEKVSVPVKIPATAPAVVAPSPNTMRKRRHFEIAKKVELRKALISTASSSRLDMGKVHSLLSGPRLSWDASKAASLSMRTGDHENEDDTSCGLIVEDFHSDSRSALRTNISKALSQMASRDINTQQIIADTNSQVNADEEIQRIIEMKKKLMKRETVKNQGGSPEPTATVKDLVAEFDDGIGENLPVLEPIEEEITDTGATQEFVRRPVIEENEMSPTQIFYREEIRPGPESDEELDMDTLAMEPTQVYIAPVSEEVIAPVRETQKRIESKSSVGSSLSSHSSSSFAIPPNTIREDVIEDSPADLESSESEAEEEEKPILKEVPRQIKKKDQMEFSEWLAARQQRKKQRRKAAAQGNEARMFFEAEAEESEDEELGGIMRRGRGGDSDGSSDDDSGSSSEDGDSDLEDLVASAADEFVLEKKSGKDSKKLAKLHAKWAEERDAALEKAIEDREFLRRKQMGARGMLDDGVESGLNRMQRKLKAKREAMVEQFDREGNLLAPEYVSDSEYDSMEIDSDDFFDEDEDEMERGELDPEEIEARKERKQRDMERRKKEMEFKLEMKRRRQMLKEKLRQERLMREKDKREIQAGVGIMNEEDREVFKLVNRSQVFGYTAGKDSGNATTQSTVSSTVSSQFSFLGGGKPNTISSLPGRRRSTAAASLELE